MRKLGEQWIENYYGKNHIVKNVSIGMSGKHCSHCIFIGVDWRSPSHAICRYGVPCPIEEGCIKSLGVLNEDGCLPSPWGGYPKIIHEVDQDRIESEEDVHYDNLWCVEIHKPVLICTDEYPTKQQAIDAWNRRA